MKISILMPIYNGIEFLNESLESVKSQTYKDWEILIGVNGHKKNSDVFNTANKHSSSNIKVLDYHNIKGKSNTLNEMLNHCAEVCCLLDVDDKWHPEKLSRQVEYISSYDVVGTRCQYFGDRNDHPDVPTGHIDRGTFMSFNPIINSSSMFYKKDAHWDPALSVEDYDMWLRLNKEGKRFFNHSDILTYHRIHNNSYFNTRNHDQEINQTLNRWRIS
jgi:glycosyltransferase involved in cell wall biosynthesis